MTGAPADREGSDSPNAANPEDAVDVYRLRAQTIVNLEKLLDNAHAEIALLRGSTSWRITAPLRAAGHAARRLLGRSS